VFNGDEGGELTHWFKRHLVSVVEWECEHPDNPVADCSRKFVDYIPRIVALNLKVFDVQMKQRAYMYLDIIDSNGIKFAYAGRADYIISSARASRTTCLSEAICVVEIQSKDNEQLCELQLQSYMLILMNTQRLRGLLGFLVLNNGNCRVYRASRSEDGDCIYEENDVFHVCFIADVIQSLLQ